jgi:hypothetical protein
VRRPEFDAGKSQWNIALASMRAFGGPAWVNSEGLYAERSSSNLYRIANAPVDDNTAPTICHSESCQLPADQGAAHGPAAIHNEDATLAGLF